MALYSIHLFAGGGGGILGDLRLGHTPICAVEVEPYAQKVLLQRQIDGFLPVFPIWDDVRTFRRDNPDVKPFFDKAAEIADRLVVCGGFPCQDISSAGTGEGLKGARSGLWREFARIVGEIRPRHVFVENSPLLAVRGLGTVLGDLSELGYDANWGVLGACNRGFHHHRHRMWIAGWRRGDTHAAGQRLHKDRMWRQPRDDGEEFGEGQHAPSDDGGVSRSFEAMAEAFGPRCHRVDDGLASGLDFYLGQRVKCVGNGQVPDVVELAWKTLMPAGV